MALNCVMQTPNYQPILLPNETKIVAISEGVEIVLKIPATTSTTSSTAAATGNSAEVAAVGSSSSSSTSTSGGGNGTAKRLKAIGSLWLTDQRLIFTSPPPPGQSLSSLSIPLPSILSTHFNQPTFSSNYLSFVIKPLPGGGLPSGNGEGETECEVRFRDQPMFQFVGMLEKTRERAIYMGRRGVGEDEGEGLPTYTYPEENGSVSMVGGVPVENPPGYDA